MATVDGWRLDSGIVDTFSLMQNRYKKEAPRAFAALLNDMAFTFCRVAPWVLSTRYTIRNQAFMRYTFHVMEKAKAESRLLDIHAAVTSNYRARHTKFSGWTEELGGRETRTAYYTRYARGGNLNAPVSKRYVTRAYADTHIPDVEATSIGSLAKHRQIPAFIKAAQGERAWTHKRNKTGGFQKTAKIKGDERWAGQFAMMNTPLFRMESRRGYPVLWRFANDDIASGRIEPVKIFAPPRRKIRAWDWENQARDTVFGMSEYQADHVFERYLYPLFARGNP